MERKRKKFSFTVFGLCLNSPSTPSLFVYPEDSHVRERGPWPPLSMNQHHGPLGPRRDLLAHAAPDELLEPLLLVRQHHQRRRVELLRSSQNGVAHALAGARAGELVHDVDGERVGGQGPVRNQARELACDKGPRGLLEGVFRLVRARRRRSVVEGARGGGGGADSRDYVEEMDDVFEFGLFWRGCDGGGGGGRWWGRLKLRLKLRLSFFFLSGVVVAVPTDFFPFCFIFLKKRFLNLRKKKLTSWPVHVIEGKDDCSLRCGRFVDSDEQRSGRAAGGPFLGNPFGRIRRRCDDDGDVGESGYLFRGLSPAQSRRARSQPRDRMDRETRPRRREHRSTARGDHLAEKLGVEEGDSDVFFFGQSRKVKFFSSSPFDFFIFLHFFRPPTTAAA